MLLMFIQVVEFDMHGGVATRELFYGEVLDIVVG